MKKLLYIIHVSIHSFFTSRSFVRFNGEIFVIVSISKRENTSGDKVRLSLSHLDMSSEN